MSHVLCFFLKLGSAGMFFSFGSVGLCEIVRRFSFSKRGVFVPLEAGYGWFLWNVAFLKLGIVGLFSHWYRVSV